MLFAEEFIADSACAIGLFGRAHALGQLNVFAYGINAGPNGERKAELKVDRKGFNAHR
jgi:hypothetical protein